MTNVQIHPEAWVGWGIVVILLSVFILIPLAVMVVQIPQLWRKRRYALFSLMTFIWVTTVVTILASVLPMFIAIKIPYH
jgi:ABC-type sulfate transport system permease component